MNIFGTEYVLSTPLSETDVRQLKAGDVVYINGVIWSGKNQVMRRYLGNGEPLPIDTRALNVFITGEQHSTSDPLRVIPTLGMRFERWIPPFIRQAGLRALITKGDMGQATRDTCAEVGCVQLMPLGWTFTSRISDLSADKATEVEVYWGEEGLMEALVVYHVTNSGPWVVNIDARGNALFDTLYHQLGDRIQRAYRKIGVSPD